MSSKAELIFMKWKADLAEMDRSKAAVEGNFDLLFNSLNKSKISMDEALTYLDKASKAHYPSDHVIKTVYKSMKKFGRSETLTEFDAAWKDFIANAAKRVFFSIHTLEEVDSDSAPKYGSMSASEYRKQQKYADSHPTLDWEALLREQKISEENKGPDIDPCQVDVNIDLGDL